MLPLRLRDGISRLSLGMRGVLTVLTRSDHDFYIDCLQFELVVNRLQQRQYFFIRHMAATHFDPSRSALEFRMRFSHFAVQDK